jgi:hypothetical protein
MPTPSIIGGVVSSEIAEKLDCAAANIATAANTGPAMLLVIIASPLPNP